jgi:hypothetical protein
MKDLRDLNLVTFILHTATLRELRLVLLGSTPGDDRLTVSVVLRPTLQFLSFFEDRDGGPADAHLFFLAAQIRKLHSEFAAFYNVESC